MASIRIILCLVHVNIDELTNSINERLFVHVYACGLYFDDSWTSVYQRELRSYIDVTVKRNLAQQIPVDKATTMATHGEEPWETTRYNLLAGETGKKRKL